MIEIKIDEKVKELGVYLYYAAVKVDNILTRDIQELYSEISKVVQNVRSRLSLDKLKDEFKVRVFRDLYWKLGIDPTKQRPAHEALLRRVLHGEELPRINPLVDIGNLASIKYMLPVGIYDLDKIGDTRLELRFAREGEQIQLIGGKTMKLTQNQIVLATVSGKILHVFPHRDSADTAITESTRRALIVVAGVRPVPEEEVESCIREIIDLARRYLNAEILQDVRKA